MHSSEELIRVNLADIQQAHQRLLPVIRPTELDRSLTASKLLGLEVFLKLENMQYTGSFKFRGAYNKISRLTDEQKALGVIASSAGNHAQGVARAATLQGVRSKIIMPVGASLVKSEATKNYGAEVIFHGQTVDEAIEFARDLVAKESWTFVHPYEDPDIIAGQGTIGLEIAAAAQDWDSVI
ncbi:MAG: pyridoxal-phosphate dependent enzyme, partial [Bdellovibrionaceae bacterium]|nr:pyridoxal-phosphate dependent enzyme [Pseudobdellovibrionaceae bacterium]